MSTADRITVLRAGRVVQTGSPPELYRRPVDVQLAGLLGTAVVLPGTVDRPGIVSTSLGVHDLDGPAAPGTGVDVLVRPEDVLVGEDGAPGVVRTVRFAGADTLLAVDVPGAGLVTVRERSVPRRPGDRVALRVKGSVPAWSRG